MSINMFLNTERLRDWKCHTGDRQAGDLSLLRDTVTSQTQGRSNTIIGCQGQMPTVVNSQGVSIKNSGIVF